MRTANWTLAGGDDVEYIRGIGRRLGGHKGTLPGGEDCKSATSDGMIMSEKSQ
jgi:hypothetical protein